MYIKDKYHDTDCPQLAAELLTPSSACTSKTNSMTQTAHSLLPNFSLPHL